MLYTRNATFKSRPAKAVSWNFMQNVDGNIPRLERGFRAQQEVGMLALTLSYGPLSAGAVFVVLLSLFGELP